MLFNSWQFALFFPLVTAVYFALPRGARWAWLLLASCAFYMAFVPAYILILAVTIGVDYLAGLAIEASTERHRRLYLLASVAVNLGMLGFFKYFNFFNANIATLAGLLHWNYPIQALQLLLPIGLSFHVFQSLSYTIEVYRGNQAAERHVGIFALYVMFYPQLVAGPIERPQNLLHQFHAAPGFDEAKFVSGLRRMAWGLFKKTVIADRIAGMVTPMFAAPGDFHGVTLALAAVLFSFQIYCDFSGYSDIAVGAARVMGFDLMENFRQPYFSRSVAEFWTRWHISLSTWFRDYVYIPLGGNRAGSMRWIRNVAVVFLASGLWHGANWTYVAWGALHGLYMMGGRFLAGGRGALARATGLVRQPRVLAGLQGGTTFGLVTFAWIFFRAPDLATAWTFVSRMGLGLREHLGSHHGLWSAIAPLDPSGAGLVCVALAVGALECVHFAQRRPALLQGFDAAPRWVRWPAYQALVWVIVLFGVFRNQAFIYFQF